MGKGVLVCDKAEQYRYFHLNLAVHCMFMRIRSFGQAGSRLPLLSHMRRTAVVSDTIGRTGHRESVASGTHVWLACQSEPRCGRTVGRPLACVPCAHWTHRRSEERDSADDTIAVARRGQIDRALVADLLVGGKNVQCGRDAPSARPFSWHEHGGHRCHPTPSGR